MVKYFIRAIQWVTGVLKFNDEIESLKKKLSDVERFQQERESVFKEKYQGTLRDYAAVVSRWAKKAADLEVKAKRNRECG